MSKELIKNSFDFGIKGFYLNKNAPYLNIDFINTVPNCEFGDEKGCELRIKMYKSYVKGWTQENLK